MMINQQLSLTGVVLAYAGVTAPPGFLVCDGSLVSRSAYAGLFAVIGVNHGAGDGTTTFALPDYRGRFLRGVANGSANDPDRATRTAMSAGGNTGDNVGSVQADAFGSHNHNYSGSDISVALSGSSGYTLFTRGVQNPTTENIPGNRFDPNDNLGAIFPSGGNETRPKNAGVNFIIKT